jgi:hypothetical protein
MTENKQKAMLDAMKSDWQKFGSDPVKVEVPEWDLEFYVFPMTLADEARLRKLNATYPDHDKFNMIVARAKDENRRPLFSDLMVKEMASYVRQDLMNRTVYEILKADRLVPGDDDDAVEEALPTSPQHSDDEKS